MNEVVTFRILALDPGGQTGWATYTAQRHYFGSNWEFEDRAQEYRGGTLTRPNHHAELSYLLESQHVAEFRVVTERYVQRPNNPAANDISKEYEGVVKGFCEERNVHLQLQMPAVAKTFVKDSNLKRLGLWVPGRANRHMMDGFRHLIYDMIHHLGREDLVRLGWK